MKILILLIALLPYSVQADETFFGFGLGIANSAKNSVGETKNGQIGYRSDLINGVYWQYKFGYFGDGSGDKSRRSSLYAFTGPGMTVDLRPVEFKAGVGLGGISHTDSYLGGHFPQFNSEIYFGFRDRRGNAIGVKYEHISSAGLVTPNSGRDFFILELSQSW